MDETEEIISRFKTLALGPNWEEKRAKKIARAEKRAEKREEENAKQEDAINSTGTPLEWRELPTGSHVDRIRYSEYKEDRYHNSMVNFDRGGER